MDKKFIDSIELSDFEILTDDGFKDLCALHKTIKYDVYILELKTKELKCADKHIVFLESDEEIFVENLKSGNFIKTKDGIEKVIDVFKTEIKEHMWDFELTGNDVKYYTNGILSHNTTYIRKLIADLSEEKTVIYVPPYMMESIAEPGFMSFISKFKKSILILEDSENIISNTFMQRTQAIANILNMTDGLLNDHLEVQIISTFNTSNKEIDPALLRAGRLKVNYEFKALKPKQANKLCKHLDNGKTFDNPTTLSEIYEGHNQIISIQEKKRIGFQSQN